MLAPFDQVAQGRAAWERIKSRSKPMFDDWLLIGTALVLGRSICMAAAGIEVPYGPRYHAQIKRWLAENGLSDLDSHERLGAIFCAENQAKIEKWRAGLPEVARLRANHPNTILKHFRMGTVPQRQGPKTTCARIDRPSQDMLRRVAAKMRENWTNDVYRLAAIAIQAVASDPDRDALFRLPPPRKPAPIELHA